MTKLTSILAILASGLFLAACQEEGGGEGAEGGSATEESGGEGADE